MSVLLIVFAIAMAVATFVENDYGTQTSKALIYNTWWFELVMLLLTFNFIGNIFRYNLFRKEKLPIFIFHIAFIIVLIGAFISRYFGYEGVMAIRENASENRILSDNTYIDVTVDNQKDTLNITKKVLFGALGKKHYSINEQLGENNFKIETTRYIPHVKTQFNKSENGKEYLHLVVSGNAKRDDIRIATGETVKYGNLQFSFNNPTNGAINFISNGDSIKIKPFIDGKIMEMQSQIETPIVKDSLYNVELMKLYTFDNLHFILTEKVVKGEKIMIAAHKNDHSKYPYDALFLNVKSGEKSHDVIVYGGKNLTSEPVKFSLNGMNFIINYGAKYIEIPFALKLRNFEMERYPGTNSASSYASEVTVLDKDKSFDYRIFMNHVLDYKGFRFFQSSYDADEKGTVLSVNHDFWGTMVTYVGYGLMFLGMILTLFWKGSRFYNVIEKLNKTVKLKNELTILFLMLTVGLFAQHPDSVTNAPNDHNQVMQDQHEIESIHNDAKTKNNVVSKVHADKFGALLIQDFQGRLKPVNTYALEALRKVYKKDYFNGLTAEQVMLSAQLDPYYWEEQKLIHVKSNALGKTISDELGVENGSTSINNFFNNAREKYYLDEMLQNAQIKKNMERTATDKEIINLDERFNVLTSVISGNVLKLYPLKNDKNNNWVIGFDADLIEKNDTLIAKMHQNYMRSLAKAVATGDYTEADKNLEIIKKYQLENGGKIIPNVAKTQLEIKYNRWNIFKKLMLFYMFFGFTLLIIAFITLFRKPSKSINILSKILTNLITISLIFHVIGLGVRWYISGHAPWSDGYESILFVACISIFIGLIFSFGKSKFILAATVIFSALLLGIAHGSTMNPEITNLVPVLKSYWLMIHVAVITASYAFLGLGALLGFFVLLLFILKNKENETRINLTIDELTYVNELTLTVGLFTLSIGTFLGGIWANESWGRYWSWDPKEVWSLISMMIYVFILHMRMVPGLRGKFIFNLASLWAISTLIMTFFGVNFYLSGMHSYAAGDPVPIPVWVYVATGILLIFSLFSYFKFNRLDK